MTLSIFKETVIIVPILIGLEIHDNYLFLEESLCKVTLVIQVKLANYLVFRLQLSLPLYIAQMSDYKSHYLSSAVNQKDQASSLTASFLNSVEEIATKRFIVWMFVNIYPNTWVRSVIKYLNHACKMRVVSQLRKGENDNFSFHFYFN